MDHWLEEEMRWCEAQARREMLADLRQIVAGKVPDSWEMGDDPKCQPLVDALRTSPCLSDVTEAFEAIAFGTCPTERGAPSHAEWAARCYKFCLRYLRRNAGIFEPTPLFEGLR